MGVAQLATQMRWEEEGGVGDGGFNRKKEAPVTGFHLREGFFCVFRMLNDVLTHLLQEQMPFSCTLDTLKGLSCRTWSESAAEASDLNLLRE